MPVSERAKQFMPFAAVRGLNEALAKKERDLGIVQKTELSEEMADELNAKLALLQKGSIATVTYFCDGEYRSISGEVLLFNVVNRILRIADTKITFDDILDISMEETAEEDSRHGVL
ncbi:hypothetical protein DESME_09420 [Desulfitobacterium metallireducens DSM 15288]|uniref:YolD-like protein n=2 Tax=Desulfitobacterium TaxID=36853 RepID=W0EDU3_9FIRM|nr:hypothetical protein DESME_09420 [Desulfitobacterium metallireducens DSM 15288]